MRERVPVLPDTAPPSKPARFSKTGTARTPRFRSDLSPRLTSMNLGIGLYKDLLTDENFRFAKQAGATHVVVHLVDYFRGKNPSLDRGLDDSGWGVTTDEDLWTYDELVKIKDRIESHGLTWEAIENFDPAHWHDVLLDGPRKQEQLDHLKEMIRDVGRAGIPTIGYNFSIAGVWGWTKGPYARGDAMSLRYDESEIDKDKPIPNGMVWNMRYDADASDGYVPPVSSEELWERFEDFLQEMIPVAEESGVTLALHPDDPPTDRLRRTARLVNRPEKYQRALELVPSDANALEFCLGSLQEMPEGNVYESIQTFGAQDKIAYVHFRNVRGEVPCYEETFVDEGDLDMIRVVETLREVGYEGVLIPDHTPEMSCDAPWHAGMAYALGYMRAAMQAAE